jgi:glycosyltransferase involved in cell wall biosynthesis
MTQTVLNKKKILMISDHPLSTSGVGTQSRWLINGLIATGKYKFMCLGGAIKHDDYRTVVVNDDFIIKPVNGFGNRDLIRQALAVDRPDAILLFTDPRFFLHIWEMEDEVHQICPISYWHLWDNPPWPSFNHVLYDSTDLINCINYPTYEMVHERFPERTNFVPHAIPKEIFFPMSDEDRKKNRASLLGNHRADSFVALWVSRNARRKMPSDVLISWKQFLDHVSLKTGKKDAILIMHTEPTDPEGPNLHQVVDMLGIKENVVFSKDRVGFPEMNTLYNISDVLLSRSSNEGFGLSLLESMQAGTPLVALKTGGMTRQVVNHVTGEQNGRGIDPEVRSLVGNQMIPFIFEDFCSHETFTKAIVEIYEMSKEDRHNLGLKAREYALKEFNIDNMISTWDRTLTDTIDNWKSRYKKWEALEL